MVVLKKYLTSLLCFTLFILSLGVPVYGASKKEILKLNNGAVYYGELKDGKPHGKGTMTWSGDKSYSGDWFDGKRSGYGKYIAIIYDEGEKKQKKYNGYWKNDTYNGQGEYTEITSNSSDSIRYYVANGNFVNGLYKGGYELNSSYMASKFEYKDEEHYISVLSYPENEAINKLFTLSKDEYIPYLSIMKKQSNGLMKGYSYYLGMEEDSQILSEGYYTKKNDEYNLYSGTLKQNSNYGYDDTIYKNGKIQSSKEVEGGEIYSLGEQKINSHLKDISSYIKGFKQVYNRMILEKNIYKHTLKPLSNLEISKPDTYIGSWYISADLESEEYEKQDEGNIILVLEKNGNNYSFYFTTQTHFFGKANTEGKVVFNNQGKGKASIMLSEGNNEAYPDSGTIELTSTGILYTGPIIFGTGDVMNKSIKFDFKK
jgi:hypothetical protein